MTYIPNERIKSDYDLNSRQNVSEITTLFEDKFIQEIHTNNWNQLTTSGSITSTSDSNTTNLTTTAVVGSKCVLQTKNYFSIRLGKANQMTLCCVMEENGGVEGTVCKAGMFDDSVDKTVDVGFSDGTYFGLSGTTGIIGFVYTISGVITNTIIPQSEWNIDKMDGTGKSGYNLDWSKLQFYVFENTLWGTSIARWGIKIDDGIKYVHEYDLTTFPLTNFKMSKYNVPVRFEVKNNSSILPATMKVAACSVMQNGKKEDKKRHFYAASRKRDSKAVTDVETAVLSIRIKEYTDGRNRVSLSPKTISLMTSTNANMYWKIVYDATLTGLSWNDVNDGSEAEYSIAETYVSGGVILDNGYFSNDINNIQISLEDNYLSGTNIAGNTEIVTIIMANASATASEACFAAISWVEAH